MAIATALLDIVKLKQYVTEAVALGSYGQLISNSSYIVAAE